MKPTLYQRAYHFKVDRDVVAVLEFFADTQMAPDQSLLVIIDHLGEQLGRVFERKRAAVRVSL